MSNTRGSKVEKGRVVTVRFALFDEEGEKLHETPEDDPLVYLHGAENILTGLEEGLEGMALDQRFELKLPPEKAFGLPDPAKVQDVPRGEFPDDADIVVGMQFGAEDEDGDVVPVWVTGVEDDTIRINGNHPYAGLTLRCEGEVVAIRDATQEEIDHGHVHGEGHVH